MASKKFLDNLKFSASNHLLQHGGILPLAFAVKFASNNSNTLLSNTLAFVVMFNEIQVNRLVELVRANESKLFPSTFNKWNRNQSRQTWTQIACIFNSEFPTEMKTADQIRVKWKNMRQRARETGDPLSINSTNHLQNTDNKEHVKEPVDVESNEKKSLNVSIAQVLGVLGTTMERLECGTEVESECSVPSCTSDKSVDDQRTLTTDLLSSPFRRFHTPLITTGPPIFPLHSNRHFFL